MKRQPIQLSPEGADGNDDGRVDAAGDGKEPGGGPGRVGFVITTVTLILAVAHIVWPGVKIDAVTVGLVVCATLPWLGSVFKSIDLPGIGKFEYVQRQLRTLSERVEKVQFLLSGDLNQAQRARYQKALSEFRDYLARLELSPQGSLPAVRVNYSYEGSYYDPEANEIVTGKPFAKDTDELMREYAHYTLMSHNRAFVGAAGVNTRAIQSGMADYLVCSYTDDPIFGELIDPEFLRQMGRERSLRNLKNEASFLKKPKDVNQAGEPWGGAFWEIRTTLGQNVADEILSKAWVGASELKRGDTGVGFVTVLLQKLEEHDLGNRCAEVRNIFGKRGLKLE